jgi:hypothetical protein
MSPRDREHQATPFHGNRSNSEVTAVGCRKALVLAGPSESHFHSAQIPGAAGLAQNFNLALHHVSFRHGTGSTGSFDTT